MSPFFKAYEACTVASGIKLQKDWNFIFYMGISLWARLSALAFLRWTPAQKELKQCCYP